MRPFSPVFSKRVGEKMRKIPPRSQSTSALARHANEPGAWIAEEERIEVAAAKFEAASASAYGQTRSIRTSADPIWKQLLQSADSARSAIVLREIFGPPRGLQPLEFSL
jgi:hypothetical protein